MIIERKRDVRVNVPKLLIIFFMIWTAVSSVSALADNNWLDHGYGLEDVVLPGFRPLIAKGDMTDRWGQYTSPLCAECAVTRKVDVELWGRRYIFDNSLFPSSITNQGIPMLESPINWHAVIAGEKFSAEFDELVFSVASDTRTVFRGEGRLGNVIVKGETTVEYDGFMKFVIEFLPIDPSLVVEGLWMDIPLVASNSTILYYPQRLSEKDESGQVSARWHNGWQANLHDVTQTGVVTLGNGDISLQWLTESDRWYYPRGNERALQTLEKDGARVFRTNLIDSEKKIQDGFSVTFMLHAGPVRPRPQNWRGYTMAGRRYLLPGIHRDIGFTYDIWARAAGDLVPAYCEEGRIDERFKDAILFTSSHFAGFRNHETGELLPEWEEYLEEWRLEAPEGTGTAISTDIETRIDPASHSWQQFHIYNLHRLFSETGAVGLFYDNALSPLSLNSIAGSGYIDEEGILRPTSSILRQRELHRRAYAVMKRARPDSIKIMHTGGNIILPLVSFSDVVCETLLQDFSKLAVAGFRTDYTMNQLLSMRMFGSVPLVFVVEGEKANTGMMIAHDMHAIGGFTTGHEESVYFNLDRIGIAGQDIKFYPYWETDPAAKIVGGYLGNEPDRATRYFASAYALSGGALIIILCDAPSNYAGSRKIHIKLNREKLGLAEGSLHASSGIIDEEDVLKVDVGVNNYKLVVLKNSNTD